MRNNITKTGLYFGSFNPIHLGHLMIASYMVEFTDINDIWFIISPHNPLKKKSTLLPDVNRLYMVNVAVEDEPRFKASNIEFHLPQPSYTIDTLTYMQEKYPNHEFILLAGSDILPTFHKWKNYEQLLSQYKFYIYPRPHGHCEESRRRRDDEATRSHCERSEATSHPSLTFVDAPMIEISASFIRNGIREGKNMQYFLPPKVWKYVEEMGFYR
ncbi:MAG: nicotinate-nucleotide adenylyltransferase [Bacteroidia bacterium]|nr:nicotinate-nucleotide adenylyltransferase [Bacteroidia bacterium]